MIGLSIQEWVAAMRKSAQSEYTPGATDPGGLGYSMDYRLDEG